MHLRIHPDRHVDIGTHTHRYSTHTSIHTRTHTLPCCLSYSWMLGWVRTNRGRLRFENRCVYTFSIHTLMGHHNIIVNNIHWWTVDIYNYRVSLHCHIIFECLGLTYSNITACVTKQDRKCKRSIRWFYHFWSNPCLSVTRLVLLRRCLSKYTNTNSNTVVGAFLHGVTMVTNKPNVPFWIFQLVSDCICDLDDAHI